MLHGLILTTKQRTFVAKEAAARFAGPTAAQAQAAVTVQNCCRAYIVTQLHLIARERRRFKTRSTMGNADLPTANLAFHSFPIQNQQACCPFLQNARNHACATQEIPCMDLYV